MEYQTKHYSIKNIGDFSNDIQDKIKKYINDIENIFPIIEKVFGQKWTDDYIYICLMECKRSPYYKPIDNERHEIYFSVLNNAVNKKYPENLWGCLLHETLHAFTFLPINNESKRILNDFDGICDCEPFLRSFQRLVYFELYREKILTEELYHNFIKKLEKEIMSKKESIDLYRRYNILFNNNISNFSKFIKIIDDRLPDIVIKKDTIDKDLDNLEKLIN